MHHRLSAFLEDHEDFRNFLVSGSGALVAPVINLASVPVVMRIYGPAEYGLWILIQSFGLLAGNVATLRYDLAVVLAADAREAGRTMGLCFTLTTALAALTALVVALAPLWAGLFPALEGALPLLWFVPAVVWLLGVVLTSTAGCTLLKGFAYNSAALITLAAVTNGLQMILPKLGLTGSPALLVGNVSGLAASAAVVTVGAFRRGGPELRAGLRERSYGDLIRRHANFPRYSVPYSFVATLRLEGAKILFGAYGSARLVGDYSFAMRLTNFPAMLFGSGLRPVIFQRASRPGELPRLEQLIRHTMHWLSLLMVPALVIYWLETKTLIGLVAGDKWLDAAGFARVLIFPALVFLHMGWLDRLFDVQGRQRLALFLQVGFSLASLLALAMGLRLGGGALWGVVGQSTVFVIYYVTALVVTYRISGYPVRRLVSVAMVPLVVAALQVAGWQVLQPLIGQWPALLFSLVLIWSVGGWLMWHWHRRERTLAGPPGGH